MDVKKIYVYTKIYHAFIMFVQGVDIYFKIMSFYDKCEIADVQLQTEDMAKTE